MLIETSLLIGAASWRLWRLIARDDITEWTRRRLAGWPLLLVECAWCLGTWVAVALTFAVNQIVPLRLPWLIAGASAAVVGLLEEISARLRPE